MQCIKSPQKIVNNSHLVYGVPDPDLSRLVRGRDVEAGRRVLGHKDVGRVLEIKIGRHERAYCLNYFVLTFLNYENQYSYHLNSKLSLLL